MLAREKYENHMQEQKTNYLDEAVQRIAVTVREWVQFADTDPDELQEFHGVLDTIREELRQSWKNGIEENIESGDLTVSFFISTEA